MQNNLSIAKGLYENGKFQEAYEILSQEIAENPNDIFVLEWMARSLFRLKRYADVITECQRIIHLDPKYAIAYSITAEAFYLLKDYANSKQAIQTGYSISPNNKEVLLSYGVLLFKDKRFDEASEKLEQAIQTDPNYFLAYYNLAIIYTKIRNWKRVLFCTKELYRLKPTVKYAIALFFAYMDYYRIGGILNLICLSLLLFAGITRQWGLLSLAVSYIGMVFLLQAYYRKP